MKTIALTILFSVLIVIPAQSYTGNDWLEVCEKEKQGFDLGLCLGYLKGVRDVMDLYNSKRVEISITMNGKSRIQTKFCIPQGEITLGQ